MQSFISEIKEIASGLIKFFRFKIVFLFVLFVLLIGIFSPSFTEFDIKYNFNVIKITPRFNILGI